MNAPKDRTAVTSPRSRAPRRPPRVSTRREVDEQTGLGEVYLRSLLRAQLRLSLYFLAGLVLTVGAVPLAFALDPGLADTTLFGAPVAWLALGLASFPLLCACGWAYARAADRTEREFTEMMGEQ